VVAVSAALGPTVASAVLAVAHWRWLFGINLPLGVLALTIAVLALPPDERAHRAFNYAGALLYGAACALLLSGLQSLSHAGSRILAGAELGGAALFGVLLVRHERPRSAPILPLDLLRNRLFALSVVTSVCAFTAQSAALVALPFEIQRLGHSAVQTGLYVTPWPLALAVMAPVAGRLADRHPAGVLGSVGLLVLAAGLALLAFLPSSGGISWVWRMALCGLGFGFFQSPNNRTLLSAAPRARSGAAGGMLGVARLTGQSLGAAAVAILFGAFGPDGSHLALYAAVVLALIGAVFSAVRLTGNSEQRP
jgi:MFS transporter, DHA2 family, multidrug resistance protein